MQTNAVERRLKSVLAVSVGGAMGAGVRWLVTELFVPGGLDATGDAESQGATTGVIFAINVVGSFLLGGLTGRRQHLSENWYLGAGTGFAGGLTTFSTFAVAIASDLDDGRFIEAAGNGLGTAAVALLAAGIGYRVGLVRR